MEAETTPPDLARPRRRSALLLEGAGCVALHLAAVTWLTWPLVSAIGTALPLTAIGCRADSLLVAWSLAHQSRSLAGNLGTFLQGGIFHPTPDALLYGEAAFGAVPVFAPVFLATGNAGLALNVVFLAGVALTATAIHLVVRRWTGLHSAGVVAAATFLATPWVLWTWGPVAPNYVCLFYLPVIVFLAAAPVPTVRRTILLGMLVVLQGLCSAYLAAATLAPLGVLGLVRLVRARTRATGAAILAAALAAAAILAVPYGTYLAVRQANPKLGFQSLFLAVRFAFTRLPWGPFAPGAPAGIPAAAWMVLALGAVVGLVRLATGRRRPGGGADDAWGATALWTGVALIASLTSIVSWNGRLITLPHGTLLWALGVYDVVREPGRLAVGALVGLALLVGWAFATITTRCAPTGWTARATRALLAGVVVSFYWMSYAAGRPNARADYPLQTAIQDEAWLDAAVAAHPGPLLELPVGPGAFSHARAMYRAIYHRQPILNGHSGYWPADFPPRMALACRVPDADAVSELRRTTGLATILVQLDRAGAPFFPAPAPYDCERWDPDAWRALAARGGGGPLRLIARHGESLLFAVSED